MGNLDSYANKIGMVELLYLGDQRSAASVIGPGLTSGTAPTWAIEVRNSRGRIVERHLTQYGPGDAHRIYSAAVRGLEDALSILSQ